MSRILYCPIMDTLSFYVVFGGASIEHSNLSESFSSIEFARNPRVYFLKNLVWWDGLKGREIAQGWKLFIEAKIC